MSKRGPDHQKREARQSLWDLDGQHSPKRYRNKGKGRGKDRREVSSQLSELASQPHLDERDSRSAEIAETLYCHHHGPCEKCRSEDADQPS